MSGDKTHQQQRQIIEKRVDTSNADKDFDPRPYLNASRDVRDRITETDVRRPTDIGSDDGAPGSGSGRSAGFPLPADLRSARKPLAAVLAFGYHSNRRRARYCLYFTAG